MSRPRSINTDRGSVFEFRYGDSLYRFVKPDVRQLSFYSIHKTGVFYEHDVLRDMRQRLKGRELVIDVGANIGNHTVFLAGVCHCDVIAFEPYPKTFEVLKRNIDLNGLNERVTAINVAAGARHGYGKICLPSTANYGQIAISETNVITSVRIDPLDSFDFPRPPRLLKIDVEGSEIDVLKGAQSLIRQSRPLIYLEALDEKAFSSVCKFLDSLDYRAAKFFEPATFLFMGIDDLIIALRDDECTNQLARLCLRYYIERKKAKNTWLRRLKKRIKGKPARPSEIGRN